ncbi:MAG: diacylglycerol kinase family protein [Oscillospiraceae bacterium]|nr:diacylglycerol kinase family protein [Oscillospiraceae bacterium]
MKAFAQAFAGLWHCIKYERHFRVHLTAAVYVLVFAPYFALSRGQWAALILVVALVPAAELFNTALEAAVDLASPERQPLAKTAKDAAAGAVLLCAIGAVAVGLILFWQPDVWRAIWTDLWGHWWKSTLLIVSLPVAVWWIAWKWEKK